MNALVRQPAAMSVDETIPVHRLPDTCEADEEGGWRAVSRSVDECGGTEGLDMRAGGANHQ